MSRDRRTARSARFAAVVGAALVGLLAVAVPAGAHSAAGTMGIEVTPGSAPLTAKVRVLLEFASDGHVAPGATVTATATGPAGATVAATPLTDQGQGSYDTVLTLPAEGAWTVTVTATDPAATATATVAVAASASTSGTLQGDLGSTPTTTGDDGIEISSDRAAQDERESDGGGGPSPAVLAAIAVVLVAAAGAAFIRVRRR